MAEFVKEDDDGQDEQEGDRVTDEPMAQRIETVMKNLGHPISLNQSRRPRPQPTRMPLRQFEARGRRPYFAHYGQWQWRRRPRSKVPGSRCEPTPRWWLPPAARWRQI